jgi:hypothetical protein
MIDSLGGENLGNLAQSARTQQLKTARGILFAIGILTIVVNLALVIFAKSFVDSQFEKELKDLRAKNMVVDPVKVEELRDQSVRSVRLLNSIAVVIGVVFIVCAIVVYTYPVAATVTSLVLYLGGTAVFGVLDPTTLYTGWIVKILIIVGLFKAVQAALAYESERKAAAASAQVPGFPVPPI